MSRFPLFNYKAFEAEEPTENQPWIEQAINEIVPKPAILQFHESFPIYTTRYTS